MEIRKMFYVVQTSLLLLMALLIVLLVIANLSFMAVLIGAVAFLLLYAGLKQTAKEYKGRV